MDHTQQEILQQQLAEKAKHAAAVTAAGGQVVKNAFLATITGAKTAGEKAVVFGAMAGFVAFFLPWVVIFGPSLSGFKLAVNFSGWFWLYPVTMVLCCVLASLKQPADARERILTARYYIIIGVAWFATGVALVTSVLSGALGIGGYVATLSSGSILLGGMMQIKENLARLSSSDIPQARSFEGTEQ